MKIVSIVGPRPQFIKHVLLSKEMRKDCKEVLVHTGQHYDYQMSEVFFKELNIPKPDYNLGVGSGSHGEQTGKILIETEKVLLRESPDIVIVYGDTNSTLAGALAAAKLKIKVVHVEAGMRSFDRTMPEEINRVITDHISNLLFCSTQTAVDNLANEGIRKGVYLVGDVMVDVLKENLKIARQSLEIVEKLGIKKKKYFVLTVHRSGNTDSKENLAKIIEVIGVLNKIVVFPIHPRTKKYLDRYNLLDKLPRNIKLISPLGYLDMIRLMIGAERILTDSGGMQKEAYILGVPCITLRENTEWVETLKGGWNVLAGVDKEKIVEAASKANPKNKQKNIFGDGKASKRIVQCIKENEKKYYKYRQNSKFEVRNPKQY